MYFWHEVQGLRISGVFFDCLIITPSVGDTGWNRTRLSFGLGANWPSASAFMISGHNDIAFEL
jgi:hypothetical protein